MSRPQRAGLETRGAETIAFIIHAGDEAAFGAVFLRIGRRRFHDPQIAAVGIPGRIPNLRHCASDIMQVRGTLTALRVILEFAGRRVRPRKAEAGQGNARRSHAGAGQRQQRKAADQERGFSHRASPAFAQHTLHRLAF